jgi:phenylpyruvate tautomerase PptA (4-oxalocrotonate tautomerase family)
MPLLEVTVPEGALDDEAKRELPPKLAAKLLEWEGAPDTAFFRSISWAHVNELPAETMHTADGLPADPHAIVFVTTPQGALSERRRAGLVEDVTKLMLEATGWGAEAGLRVWVLCREIEEGSWAANGQIVRFEQLRAAANAESERAGSGKEKVPAAAGDGAVRA